MDNYEISRNRAQEFFLGFDQDVIIRTWNLKHDETHLYVDFLGTSYAVRRENGEIYRLPDWQQAGFSEVLSIFDLLCHDSPVKFPAGTFAPVNSLNGSPKAGGVGTSFHRETAAYFDREPEKLHRACLSMGATPVDMGDIGYQFHLFGPLSIIMKFYHSDEDFPAGVTLLWDSNTLQYIFYETVFYIAGFLVSAIAERMKQES